MLHICDGSNQIGIAITILLRIRAASFHRTETPFRLTARHIPLRQIVAKTQQSPALRSFHVRGSRYARLSDCRLTRTKLDETCAKRWEKMRLLRRMEQRNCRPKDTLA